MKRKIPLAIVLVWALLAGCGVQQGPERIVVSGVVTFNGKPIPNGKISFLPDQTSNAPITVAPITDGHFAVDSHGGVPVGNHKVQIEAYHPISRQDKPGAAVPPTAGMPGIGPQYLPARYNAQTELQLMVESEKRELTQNFDLTD